MALITQISTFACSYLARTYYSDYFGPTSKTKVIGKVTYTENKAYIEVYESWTSNIEKIQISQGKFNTQQKEICPIYYSELPPNNSIIYYSSRLNELEIIESYSKLNKFQSETITKDFDYWTELSSKDLKNLYEKLGTPKYYPNGKTYKIENFKENYSFTMNHSWVTNIEDKNYFLTSLKDAKIVSIGAISKENNNFILKVKQAWNSSNKKIYLSHGNFDSTKEIPLNLEYPNWDELAKNKKSYFIISFLSPNKINKPLKREFSPQDMYPNYKFASLKYSNTIILEVTEENINLIERILGKPKFNFEIKK